MVSTIVSIPGYRIYDLLYNGSPKANSAAKSAKT